MIFNGLLQKQRKKQGKKSNDRVPSENSHDNGNFATLYRIKVKFLHHQSAMQPYVLTATEQDNLNIQDLHTITRSRNRTRLHDSTRSR